MIDYQHRVGHKTGSGAPASAHDVAAHQRERLRKLALETFDLNKDPYFSKNHMGHVECRLCLTVHTTESSYLSHTQGRKHQMNLARRAAKEQKDAFMTIAPISKTRAFKAPTLKIGRPGYRITKMRDPETKQPALLFEIEFPEIQGTPKYRFMSAFEQKIEIPPDPNYQFLLFAADPYETIAFKVPNLEIDNGPNKLFSYFDDKRKLFIFQVHFKLKKTFKVLPGLPQRPTKFDHVGPGPQF
ncbi:Zinc-finger of C2H2 type family protein [Theileria parva strain Muguga]|uniref:Splicing factor 3a subunit 2, putative n=1 Tax=Theileria annulata TaxID=5874 RepID=Q4UEZ1_THEAN|nr:Zinc-finger of C2H2 type family protein [Theileria parva strain Muguga]XP_952080.1 splicing factor 3a subunit 2, putative [Theileria annulata]EAN32919.2 Zinc-finger of C2H2 type family protein [Theileria parva strain Muguga]CAI74348.1 splicing factor 3a subunit 2, putative [Theileria annulata]|eukprot:XP_952080.1 splicing factor 3a subunit 2, putative [Theileria annulata]